MTGVRGVQVWNTNRCGSGIVGIFNVQVSLSHIDSPATLICAKQDLLVEQVARW